MTNKELSDNNPEKELIVEKSSPHLLPILFNPKQLKDELIKKVDSLEIKNS